MSPRKSGVTESALHKQVAEFLEWALLPPTVYTTFPAGWFSSPAIGGKLKGRGLKRGFPDLLFFPGGSRCFGIELKTETGKPSPAQQLMFPRLRAVGIHILVCQNLDQVVAALHEEGVPLRVRWTEGVAKWQDGRHVLKKRPLGVTSEGREQRGDGNGAAQRETG